MAVPLVHWRYLREESLHRWRRTVLTVGGIAMAVALVVLLDMLGRAFADISALPFRNLGADLIVQRSATEAALPKQMGIMLPYSAQPITGDEMKRLSAMEDVEKAGGFVLLWNFGAGRFYSISGIPLGADTPSLGPGRVRNWLLKGRLPAAGAHELLVERHYGAFYRLDPGTSVDMAGRPYTVVGVADIKEGSQIAASNFFIDIDQARELAALPPDGVNQVFLKVAHIDRTEAVKAQVAAVLPRASVMSPDTMLKLFGGISQVVGRFRSAALVGGGLAALALAAMLIYGTLAERRKEAGILRALGWTPREVRRQFTAEMVVQGLAGGVLALMIVALGMLLLANITLTLPASLPGENPIDFAGGGFRAAPERVALPILATMGDWLLPPVLAGIFCGLIAWWLALRLENGSPWAAVKAV